MNINVICWEAMYIDCRGNLDLLPQFKVEYGKKSLKLLPRCHILTVFALDSCTGLKRQAKRGGCPRELILTFFEFSNAVDGVLCAAR